MNTRPNVLLLFTDEQRWDAMRCSGNSEIKTPNLDRLAETSVRFKNAYTPTPICQPARMSLITGHRGSRTGYLLNRRLPGGRSELPTIMTLLHDAGYYCHGVGKMHFDGRLLGFQKLERQEQMPIHRVDDDYLMYLQQNGVRTRDAQGEHDLLYYQPQTLVTPPEHSPPNWVKHRSIQALREHAKYRPEQPLFLWSSFLQPHPPFAAVEPYASMYDPDEIGLPFNVERPMSDLPAVAWTDRARIDGAHRDPKRIRRLRALYYALVSHVDQCIGEILDELERLGVAENTVVIFTSDHGDMLGDHGLSQKRVPYDSSAKIPLLVRWPGVTEPARVCEDIVGLTDVLPTLIDGLDLQYPSRDGPLPGESLISRPGGGLASGRQRYFIDIGNGPERQISVRTPTYKYTLWSTGRREELYDMRNDPHECHNMVEELPELTGTLRREVLQWERQYGPEDSFVDGEFVVYDLPDPPDDNYTHVVVHSFNRWYMNLPVDERGTVQSFSEEFSQAISKEGEYLHPDTVSLKDYKSNGGQALTNTPWEEAWKDA